MTIMKLITLALLIFNIILLHFCHVKKDNNTYILIGFIIIIQVIVLVDI